MGDVRMGASEERVEALARFARCGAISCVHAGECFAKESASIQRPECVGDPLLQGWQRQRSQARARQQVRGYAAFTSAADRFEKRSGYRFPSGCASARRVNADLL